MISQAKQLSSILLLAKGLPFDKTTLTTSLLLTYRWYYHFNPLIETIDCWKFNAMLLLYKSRLLPQRLS